MNKSTLIIGGSSGIGQAIAAQSSAAGARVSIISRQPRIKGTDASWYWYQDELQTKDTSEQQITAALKHQPDTIFICNGVLHDALGMPEKSIRQLDSNILAKRLQSNLIVPAQYLHLLFRYITTTDRIKVLVFSAKIGSISDNSLGGWYSYRMSKAALNMLIKSLSIEVARLNKTACIVAVHPGTTDTPLSVPFQKSLPAGQLQTGTQTATRMLHVRDNLMPDLSGALLNWDASIIQP